MRRRQKLLRLMLMLLLIDLRCLVILCNRRVGGDSTHAAADRIVQSASWAAGAITERASDTST